MKRPKVNQKMNRKYKRERPKEQAMTYKKLHRKDQATRTTLKSAGELLCSGMVSSSCSTCHTHCVTLVKH
jgi:hypothetical protein